MLVKYRVPLAACLVIKKSRFKSHVYYIKNMESQGSNYAGSEQPPIEQ